MKKLLSIILAISMCLCLFAGCTEGGGETESTEISLAGTYEIKVWVAEKAVDLTKTQIENFNKTNTDGITIVATVEAVGEGDAATSMTTDIEAGADLYCFAQDQAARLIQAGALSKLGIAAAETVTTNNDGGSVSAVKSGDSLWAYPLTADNGYFLYYDKSVISDSIVDSLEDLIAACESAGKMFSFELEGSAWYAASFFFGTGCVSNWETGDDGDFVSVTDTFNSDKGMIAVKGMKKLLDSTCYNNSSAAESFASGIPSAVLVSGTWAYKDVLTILGDNLGVADLPSFTVDGNTYHLGSFSGCKLMGVKPQTDAKKSAVLHKLAQYLTSEECQLERFSALGWGPSNLNALQADAVKSDPTLGALAAQSTYSIPQGQIHGSWWDIGKAIATNVKAATNDAGLQAALDTYTASMEALFNMTDDQKNAWGVIGDINGDTWTIDLPMSEQADGTWKTDEAYTMSAGTQFKVRQGGNWDLAYGTPDENGVHQNYVVEADGTYYVVLNPTTGEVTLVAG